MERNTITTIDKLEIGDRFYKLNDKKKVCWTVVEAEKKTTYFRTYRFFAMKDGENFPTPTNKDTQLVFLRHKIEK